MKSTNGKKARDVSVKIKSSISFQKALNIISEYLGDDAAKALSQGKEFSAFPDSISVEPFKKILTQHGVENKYIRDLAVLASFAKIFSDYTTKARYAKLQELRVDLLEFERLKQWKRENSSRENDRLIIVHAGKQFTFRHADLGLIINAIEKRNAEQLKVIDIIIKEIPSNTQLGPFRNSKASKPEILPVQMVAQILFDLISINKISKPKSHIFFLIYELFQAAGMYQGEKHWSYKKRDKVNLIRSYLKNFQKKTADIKSD